MSERIEKTERMSRLTDHDGLSNAIESLVSGRRYVTVDEILQVLPDIEDHLGFLDDLIDQLNVLGISIIECDQVRNETPASEEAGGRDGEKTPSGAGNMETVLTDDVLGLYLTQMAEEPLLTHEEEIELARQIEIGRQAQRSLDETDHTTEASGWLTMLVEAGQAARERMGRANTRLVVSIAKRYRGGSVPFTDLIQNGNVGLMRAVDRYDHRTGYRFATYATWWIRQSVVRSLANHGRVIRIPVHTGDRIRRMFKTAQRLEKVNGEWPTPDEIAAEMKESPKKIRQLMRWSPRSLSLEQPAGREGDAELGQFIPDDKALEPSELADIGILAETVEDLLRLLAPREARILRLRYGLQNRQSYTLKEIGHKLGLSRERVRQIEHEAMAKIRLLAPDYQLRQFLE
jgi:RNA polymerase primary sigma factor